MENQNLLKIFKSPKTKWVIAAIIVLVNLARLVMYVISGDEMIIVAMADFVFSTILCMVALWLILKLVNSTSRGRAAKINNREDFLQLASDILGLSKYPAIIVEEKSADEHNIIYANGNFVKITGYATENLMNQPYTIFLTQESRAKIAEWEKLEKADGFLELQITCADGQIQPFEAYKQLVFKEDSPMYVVFLRNIHDRKVMEERLEEYTSHLEWMVNDKTEALIESENKHRTLMESMEDIIISLDSKENFNYINPAWDKHLKFDRKKMIGQHYSVHMHPDDIEKFEHMYEQAIREKINISRIEFKHKNTEGNYRTLSGNLSLLFDLDDKVNGSVLVVRDVTDHKKMEEWLAYTERMESVGLLASGLAHDFNNLFQEIIGFTRRIKRNASTSSEVKSDAESVEAIIKRATGFVKQLLSFASSQDKHEEIFDISESIERVTGLIARSSPDNISISTKLQAKQKIEGDPGQFDQVFMNLLINARDAMPKGGGILIETTDILADEYAPSPLNTPNQGRFIVIKVQDNGTGIPKDVQPKIFDPFFTTKKNGKGTGLGLSTVYGIIKNHGGVITVETPDHGGTLFTICLPAKGGTTEMEVVPAKMVPGDEITILFVDDDKDICTLTAESLQYEGFRVLTAHNGKQALEMFQAFKREIDLIVMDMIMPEMDGVTCAKKIRQINPETLIIISTGQASSVDKSLDKTKTKIIEKPYVFEDLIATIENLLKNRKNLI